MNGEDTPGFWENIEQTLGGVVGAVAGGMIPGGAMIGQILGAVGGRAGMLAPRGVLGGTVIARGRRFMLVRTPQGRNVVVTLAPRRRRYYPRARGATLNVNQLLPLLLLARGGRCD